MTDYLFTNPETSEERDKRLGYIRHRLRNGNPVSIASAVWATVGNQLRHPPGWQIYVMIMTHRGHLEIQGPFRHVEQAVDYVNGTGLDSMIFALDPTTALEWTETDDKYVTIPIVKAPI